MVGTRLQIFKTLLQPPTIPAANLRLHPLNRPTSEQPPMEKFYDHRFQRTDQWMPVYSWLESLDTDEVIKSADVSNWLNANPEIRDHLYARHSRYHLMHYIKKCHVKILKRKEKQGLIVAKLPPPTKVHQTVQVKATESPHSTGNNPSTMPKGSEIYRAKHSEASRKYEILVELEKQLIPLFGKPL